MCIHVWRVRVRACVSVCACVCYAYDTLPGGSVALATQAGDAGWEKRPLDIARTGKTAAGPGQTGRKKTLIR